MPVAKLERVAYYVHVAGYLEMMMAKRYSIAEARDNLAKIVREAEAGQEVALTRRGRAVAVLVGESDYARMVSGPRSFRKAYRAFRRDVDLARLGIDPEGVFGTVRVRSQGRNVVL